VPESLRADLAKNYNVASSGKPLAAHDNIEEIAGSPSGDLLSTADDMSKFMLAHLQNGRYADYALLRPETVRQMHAVSFVSIPGASGTALGYFRGDYNGHAVIFHAGDLSGFHTDMRLLPDDGVGLFISVNSDGAGGLLGPSYTLRAVLSQQFMDRYFPAGASLPERTTASAIEHSRIAAGEYEMSRHPSGDFMDALYLSARLTITANEDGTIETPGLISFDTGRAKKWREVGPFVWREMGGCARLNMRVEDGRVTAWLPSNLATFEVLPVPFWRSASLNVPMLLGAVFVLCATAVVWSAAALVRRRFGRDLEIVGRDALARRTAQLAVATALLFLLGYVLLIVTIAGNPSLLDVGLDPWIRLVQGIGLLSVVAAPGALWHAWSACRGRQSWWVKVSSIIVALAIVELVWFSFAFHLISAGLNY
jgi:hypothetical protein